MEWVLLVFLRKIFIIARAPECFLELDFLKNTTLKRHPGADQNTPE
jgi:hypothetical protein